MNRGENSAVEAMLHLSRPHCPPTTSYYPPPLTPPALPTPASTPYTSSFATQPASASPSRNTSYHACPPDITCASTVTTSLSPVHHKHSNPSSTLPPSQFPRPNAMRLSQLLTDDSQPHYSVTPFNTNLSQQQEQPLQDSQFAHSLQLPQVLAPPPGPHLTPNTEPVTPPFSPPVLPPLSAVTTIPLRKDVVSTNENYLPTSSWLPTHQSIVSNPSTVLTSRENTMPFPPNSRSQPFTTATRTRSTTDSVKKIVKRPYKKYYSNPTPSSHCHVCARTSKAVKFAVCARIAEGLCRKVTCYKCFAKFGWDWQSAVNSDSWVCVHCRGVCPEGRSQCYIYSRVNSKRESKRGKKAANAKARGFQQNGSTTLIEQTSGPGGRLVPNLETSAPLPLPSISTASAQGVTSYSDPDAMQYFLRPV